MHEEAPIPVEERRGFFAGFTQNHVAATLVAATFVVAGIAMLTTGRVRREVFPEIATPIVMITVPYPGATPKEVELGICQRVEEVVEGVTGVEKVTSTANEGAGMVIVEAMQSADLSRVFDDVRNRVDAITNFPEEAEEPTVARLVVRKEVINVSIFGEADERTLKELAEQARDELSALPAITQVEVAAVRPYEIAIELSEEAMRQHGLTFDLVADAVRRGSLDLPAGAIKSDHAQTLLRIEGQKYGGDEFANLVLLTKPDGARVTLGQVAQVRDGFADDDLQARFDGQPAALLKVFRVGEQDALLVTGSVRDWVATRGRELLPPGVQMATWRDESVILQSRIDLLVRNAAQGLLLVFIILTLFMRLRVAIWVAIGIPVSFLGTVALLPMFDVSINMISLFAFLLVLGIVVDDAIVVSENIVTQGSAGHSPLRAALRGAAEVRTPVFASVLTTVAAFLPMLFSIPGTDAQIWRVIPLVVIPVVLISLLESQLCLPAHLASLRAFAPAATRSGFSRVTTAFQEGFQRLLAGTVSRVYEPILRLCLQWRWSTLALGVAALIVLGAMVAAGTPRFFYFPSVDGDNVVVTLTMPQGTPTNTTRKALAQLEAAAQAACAEFDAQRPGSASVFQHMMATLGTQPFAAEQARNGGNRQAQFSSGSHLAELNVQLLPAEQRELSSDLIMRRMRELTGPIAGAVDLQFSTSFFASGKDIDVELYHAEQSVLQAAVAELEASLREMPDIKDVANSYREGKAEIELAIRPTAEPLGLSQRDLARQVRQAFFGEEAQRIQRGRDDVKVMVRYPEANRRSLAELEQMRIRTAAGAEVPLSDVATLQLGHSAANISRVDRRRALRVSGDIDENDPNASADNINQRIRDSIMPAIVSRHAGLSWAFEGDQKKKSDLLRSLAGGFGIALFVIYALMAIPLRSFLQPLLILTAVPFGIGGAIVGHIVTGYDLSILSLFGTIALAGVVVNDNIVLVDWVNRQREQGASLFEAVRTAGAARFRPILLTTLTTFVGLTPLLLEKSVQARFLVPMAVSLAFGVLFATAISLVMVPCLYLTMADLRAAMRSSWRWLYPARS